MIKRGAEKDAFADFLAKNQDKIFHIVSLPGNQGDELIHRGLYKKLRRLKITFQVSVVEKTLSTIFNVFFIGDLMFATVSL